MVGGGSDWPTRARHKQGGRTSYKFNTWFKESAVDTMDTKANALASAVHSSSSSSFLQPEIFWFSHRGNQ